MSLLDRGARGALTVGDVPLHLAYAALGDRTPAPVGSPLPYAVTCPQCSGALYVTHTPSAIYVLCPSGCSAELVSSHVPRLIATLNETLAARKRDNDRLVAERTEKQARAELAEAERLEREGREADEQRAREQRAREQREAEQQRKRAEQLEREEREEREHARASLAVSLRPKVRAQTGSRWLIDKVLARGIKQLVVALAYGGKSFLEYSKAIAIAGGVPWLGHATNRARVMFILRDGMAGDDHLARLRAISAGMGLDFDQLCSDGWVMFYDPEDDAGRPSPVHLDNPEHVAELMQVLDDLGAAASLPQLIVLDNLTKLRGNRTLGAGNDTGITDALWQPIEDLAARGITVSVLHHSNKRGGTMGSEMSSAASDVEIHLDRASKRHDAWITISGVARSACRTDMVVRFVGGVGPDGVGDGSPIRIEERAAKENDAAAAASASADEEERRAWLLASLPAKAEALYEAMNLRGVGRNATLALRKVMADDAVIVLVDGLWQAAAPKVE